ncbi:MAG TPA: hypothetical protein VFD70_04955 [Anaerolineae bacterium]|nr:hypothetical protein [Anaerolineae bacterium]
MNWQAVLVRLERYWLALTLIASALLLLLLFSPVLSIGFVNDDFIEIGARHYDALDALPAENYALWAQRFVERALVDPVSGWQIFRPTRQVLFWANYWMWHLNPLGYRLSNLTLYLAACLVVGLLAWRLSKRRSAAALALLLFAMYPVHFAPVSAVASLGHLLAGLFVGLCVLLYVLPATRSTTIGAWLACILAIGSKETALITPALLLLYEIVYRRESIWREPRAFLVRQLPFWLLAAGAVGLRLLLFGHLSNVPYQVGSWTLSYQIEQYIIFAVSPFLDDVNNWQMVAFVIVFVLLLWFYRKRREVVFGLLWVPVSLLVTLPFPPQGRYFITPSIGVALAFGSILSQPFHVNAYWTRWAAVGLTAIVLIGFEVGAYGRTTQYHNLGVATQNFVRQLKALHPQFPNDSQIVVTGLPALGRGRLFISPLHLQYAIQLAYDDRSLQATPAQNFPASLQAPDRTFFFEYGRKLIERDDLVEAIRERRQCSDTPDKAIVWKFDRDAEGWQPWNELDQFETRDGVLQIHSTGNDPFMGGPFIEVKPRELERIEITLRANAEQPTLNGELYWQTAGMEDFDAQARETVSITADDAWHTYTVKPKVRGNDNIVRLRFDPADAPAEIQVQEIAVVCK